MFTEEFLVYETYDILPYVLFFNSRLSERTYSLWGFMASHMNEYINPLYVADETPGTLIPILCPQNIK